MYLLLSGAEIKHRKIQRSTELFLFSKIILQITNQKTVIQKTRFFINRTPRPYKSTEEEHAPEIGMVVEPGLGPTGQPPRCHHKRWRGGAQGLVVAHREDDGIGAGVAKVRQLWMTTYVEWIRVHLYIYKYVL